MHFDAPLITVLVISYCSTDGIFPTLQSVFDQDYGPIEIIIADDGTPGFAGDVASIEEHARKHARDNIVDLRILESVENQGTVVNINRGIEAARGEFVKILPADDTLNGSDALTRYVEFMRERPATDIVFSRINVVSPDSTSYEFVRMPQKDVEAFNDLDNTRIANLLYKKNVFAAPSWFARRRLFDSYGLFPTTMRLVEDYPYWCMLARTDCVFGFIDSPLVNYRLSGVTSKKRPNKTVVEDLARADELYVFPYDRRYGIFQPLCNSFKRALSNYSLELAAWDELDGGAKALSIIRHPHFHVLNMLNDAVKARRGK